MVISRLDKRYQEDIISSNITSKNEFIHSIENIETHKMINIIEINDMVDFFAECRTLEEFSCQLRLNFIHEIRKMEAMKINYLEVWQYCILKEQLKDRR